jgi:hypothetical protein
MHNAETDTLFLKRVIVMSTGTTLLLTGLAVIVVCITVSAASKHPAHAWNYYHFDGYGFIAGQPPDNASPLIAVQNNVRPVPISRISKVEALALPEDKGAIAGICYIKSSGGKLASGHGYAPCPGTPVTISSGNTVITSVLSDENGFFVAILAAGMYRIGNGAFWIEANVEKGVTTLVPLRTGKRMVD